MMETRLNQGSAKCFIKGQTKYLTLLDHIQSVTRSFFFPFFLLQFFKNVKTILRSCRLYHYTDALYLMDWLFFFFFCLSDTAW